MREIVCFKTYDGELFEDENAAIEHAENLLGEQLDGLLKLFNLDITRNQEYKALIQLLKRKPELKPAIAAINALLDYEANQ